MYDGVYCLLLTYTMLIKIKQTNQDKTTTTKNPPDQNFLCGLLHFFLLFLHSMNEH